MTTIICHKYYEKNKFTYFWTNQTSTRPAQTVSNQKNNDHRSLCVDAKLYNISIRQKKIH